MNILHPKFFYMYKTDALFFFIFNENSIAWMKKKY